jgi:hypothetical protein
MIISVDESMPLAMTLGKIYGARVHLMGDMEFELFDKVMLKIVNSSITTTKVLGSFIRKV